MLGRERMHLALQDRCLSLFPCLLTQTSQSLGLASRLGPPFYLLAAVAVWLDIFSTPSWKRH